MANFPNRCQHLKINGTQCGSPALRRNRFCYFHKRFQDERIRLGADRARRGFATFVLPVLEDANSIQIALMQVMRLLVSQQMDHKTASLLLYALQTASTNLRLTKFDPYRHEVVLDTRAVADTQLNEYVWVDEEFEEEECEQEEEPLDTASPARQEERRKKEEQAEIARLNAELEADRIKYGDPKPDPPARRTPAMRAADHAAMVANVPKRLPAKSDFNPEKVRAELSEQIRDNFFPDGVPESFTRRK